MRILAVTCHPDDLEIGAGGTIAKYADRGDEVVLCHVANGNLGHVVIPPEELGAIRTKEAETAGKVLGAREVISLDVGDLFVSSYDEKLAAEICEVVRSVRPDVILTHDPNDYMRDHVETGKAVFNGSFSASVVHYITDSPAFPGNACPIYYMDNLGGVNFLPTEYVDISDTIEHKLDALRCHESQIKWMLEHDGIDFVDFVRTCAKFRGFQCGAAYAEGFRGCMVWPRIPTKRMLP